MKMMMFLTAVACLEVILSRLALAYLGKVVTLVALLLVHVLQSFTFSKGKKH